MANITGYSRGTWNQSAWNEPIPVEVTGQILNANTGNVTVLEGVGNLVSVTTNLINIDVGNVTLSISSFLPITGEELNISQGNTLQQITSKN